MRPRQLIETTVTARPHNPEMDERGREKRWQADISVAGTTRSAIDDINTHLEALGMLATSHGSLTAVRKAKGREGPGIVSVDDERWVWVERRR